MIKKTIILMLIFIWLFNIAVAQEFTQEEREGLAEVGLESLLDPTNSEESEGYIQLIDGREYYVDIETGEKTLILTTEEANEKNSKSPLLKRILIFLIISTFLVSLAIIMRITFILFVKKKRKKQNIRKQTMFQKKPLGKAIINEVKKI